MKEKREEKENLKQNFFFKKKEKKKKKNAWFDFITKKKLKTISSSETMDIPDNVQIILKAKLIEAEGP